MRPLRGVVVGSGRVKLSSGRIVSVPRVDGIRRHDAVAVTWDYIRNVPVSMAPWDPHAEVHEAPTNEPEPLEEAEDPSDYKTLDSGVLLQDSGESGDSGSGFWELVFSDGCLTAAGVV
jgi:hypothetical protein